MNVDDADDFDALLRAAGIESAEGAGEVPGRASGAGTGWIIASLATVIAGMGVLVGTLLPSMNVSASTPTPTAPALPGGASAAQHSMPMPDAAPFPSAEPSHGQGELTVGVDSGWLASRSEGTGIPSRALVAYANASVRVAHEYPHCGLGWNTLAGIGHVESDHGRIHGSALDRDGVAVPAIIGIPLNGDRTDAISDTDGGALDGDSTWDRAVGPMQFIPGTWSKWAADGNDDGVKDPQNIDDSALAAARYLCAVGGDLTDADRWIAAVAAYNNTVEYNNRVAESARYYAQFS